MTCETIPMWENNSRAHYGVPNYQFVKPMARINGQPNEIPDGYKIPLCFLERAELFQSGLTTTVGNTVAPIVPVELYIPAGAVKGGERFTAALSASVPVQAGSTDTFTLGIRVTDAAGTVTPSPVSAVTLAWPTSGGTRQIIVQADFYYDAVAGALKFITNTRSDTTYATTVGGSIPFDPAVIQRVQLFGSHANVALSESATFTFGTIGRVN